MNSYNVNTTTTTTTTNNNNNKVRFLVKKNKKCIKVYPYTKWGVSRLYETNKRDRKNSYKLVSNSPKYKIQIVTRELVIK